ncbi:hypothetical protein [Marinobacter sp. NFXS9]|uniref:hypothetical protein n=1 Tax=Marinobacter sp. NFXS9 TaxID=2818433 RepID=UPI0032DF6A16
MTDPEKTEHSGASYSETAYRSDALPSQAPLSDPGGFARALEGLNFVERLPTGSYAGLDIDVDPDVVEHFQDRARGTADFSGPTWNHETMPTDLIKTRWEFILVLAGALGDRFVFCVFALAVIGTCLSMIAFGVGFGVAVQMYLWPFVWLVGLHLFFRYPFKWLLERHPEIMVRDLGCGFFRMTGKIKFRTYRGKETFEAPFIEFDPYIAYHVQPNGPVSYKLVLRHRYRGRQTEVATVPQGRKTELYAVWDQLQRYMDVSQPLPDIPALEAYRSLDPTTAAYDAAGKRGRPADYWVTLDLDWWKREGYPEHMKKIAEFPWDSLEDKMEDSVPNLREAAMA